MDIKNHKEKRYVIFTDLDDTLLDSNYEYKEALPGLDILKKKNIPLVFCSAKTYAEQVIFKDKMGIEHPFIVEDGSAIYIPKGYFKEIKGELMGDYEVIVLGVQFEKIKEEVEKLRKKYNVRSYCTMSLEEVAGEMNLDLESAKRAKDRQFTETIIEADQKALQELKKDFNVVLGGKAIQVFGKGANKGKAVRILADMFRESMEVTTIGLGNSYNDQPMLKEVDIPVLVKNPDGSWVDINLEGLYKTEGVGPRGWSQSIKKFVLAGENG